MKSPIRGRFVRDVLDFVLGGRRLWLLPLIIVLVIVSVLAALGALAPYGLFVYPL